MAGLSAAWELSRSEVASSIESVTVYERHGRLGGKAASTRGRHGRIEEHGLHVWPGYYDNSFRLIREVYRVLERWRTAPECPIRDWDEAFAPVEVIGMGSEADGWAPWFFSPSRNEHVPGSPSATLDPRRFVEGALRLLADVATSSSPPGGRTAAASHTVLSVSSERPPWADQLLESRKQVTDAVAAARLAMRGAAGVLGQRFADLVAGSGRATLLERFLAEVRGLSRAGQLDPFTRRGRTIVDLVATCVIGIVRDGVLAADSGFAALDDVDFRAWLRSHGASADAADSPPVRALYDFVFGYRGGDPSQPEFPAGLGLLLAGKLLFDYKGALFWRMTAGMGDTVVAPLYQALRARGVQFRFYSHARHVRLSDDARSVTEIVVDMPRGVDREGFEPLVVLNGLPCFPTRAPIDPTGPRDVEVLRAGHDFDTVILAVPIAAVGRVCTDAVQRCPRWSDMVRNLRTVATRSLQIWSNRSEAELGWPVPGSVVSGYPHPFETYASMTPLLDAEDWPQAERPRSLAYFCSVLPDLQRGGEDADPLIDTSAVEVDHGGDDVTRLLTRLATTLWPGAARDGRFDWDVLHSTAHGADRLADQYRVDNVDASDRYVQATPGDWRHRMPADGTGITNLVIAGDWVDCGLNAGCIEAAVISGVQAANAALSQPITNRVLGGWRPTGHVAEAAGSRPPTNGTAARGPA